MRTIEQVRPELSSGNYDLSRHAFIRIGERNISELEIREARAEAVGVNAGVRIRVLMDSAREVTY